MPDIARMQTARKHAAGRPRGKDEAVIVSHPKSSAEVRGSLIAGSPPRSPRPFVQLNGSPLTPSDTCKPLSYPINPLPASVKPRQAPTPNIPQHFPESPRQQSASIVLKVRAEC